MGLTDDLKQALRRLRRAPGVTLLGASAVALGIGANTAIFSVVNGVLLRPLPFGDPDRVVVLARVDPDVGDALPVSDANFVDLRRESGRVFESLSASFSWSFNLAGVSTDASSADAAPSAAADAAAAERVFGSWISAEFFRTLGAAPALGRAFLPEEEAPGRDDAVVISDGLWRRRFAGDPHVLGRTLRLDGESVRVVGVMPPGFAFFREEVELWRPLTLDPVELRRSANYLELVGRLRPGVTREQAQAAVDGLAAELVRSHPEDNAGLRLRLVPARERIVGDVRPALLVLQAAVLLVLLLACADVAVLLLGNAVARRREVAVRSALGAARTRLVRQLLTEGLLLALVGGGAGLVLGAVALRALVAAAPPQVPGLARIGLDARVLAVGAALALISALVFATVPALRASAGVPARDVAAGGARVAGSVGRGRLGALLVGLQVTVAIVLLAGAGLLARSFVALRSVDLGLDPRPVLAARASLPEATYAEPPQQAVFVRDVLAEVEALPGVEAAGATAFLPLRGSYSERLFTVEGVPVTRGEEPLAYTNPATPGYFDALAVPLLEGRLFDERDRADALPVAIVNETLARRFWPAESALGKRVKLGETDEEAPWLTVVGVVRDLHQVTVQLPPGMQIYQPFQQDPWPYVSFVVRAAGEPADLAPALRRIVAARDPEIGLYHVQPLDSIVAESLGQPRFVLRLIAFLTALALLLAGIGIYGVVAQEARAREREIGIRVALGARATSVLALVLRQGVLPAIAGAAVGVGGAAAVTRLLGGLLYGVTPRDPLTFAGAAVLLLGIAGIACVLPARRALRLDPVATLRSE